MTRKELYDLVWSRPVTHIAREFGMSDVAIKKHCKKHNIPTPPVGYWTKIAHGKKVRKPRLPTKPESADALIHLSPKPTASYSKESEEAAEALNKHRSDLSAELVVPAYLPDKPTKIVKSLRAALRKTKKDLDGFIHLGDAYNTQTRLSAGSSDRALRILQTLAVKAESLGHVLSMDANYCYWRVEDETFEFKIYEVKEKNRHIPTEKELKAQAKHDEWYSNGSKVYRTWDYKPSGRLAFHITDTESYWRVTTGKVERRWRDRKNVCLEEQLVDIFIWLAAAEVQAKGKRLRIEEYRRLEAEEEERRRKAWQRKANAKELKKHFNHLLEAHEKMEKLSVMAEYMAGRDDADNSATRRIVQEVLGYREYLSQNFDAEHFQYVCNTLNLVEEEGLLIDALGSEEPEYRS